MQPDPAPILKGGTMNTKQMIKALKTLDPTGKKEIVLSGDEEGNYYGKTEEEQGFANLEKHVIIYPMGDIDANELGF